MSLRPQQDEVERIREVVNSLHEFNPMLGHRGCRLGLTYPEVSDMQVRAIIDDPAIEIVGQEGREASEISSSDSEGWKALAGAISETFPGVVVAPALVVGGTDSKHYGRIAQDAYRFTPFRMGPEDASRFHGLNERLAVDNYSEIVAFYGVLVRRAAGP